MSASADSRIRSLPQLLHALNEVALAHEFGEIFERVELSLADVQEYVRFKPDTYNRQSIRKTANYELLVLSWQPGQQSSIHCHSGSRGWMLNIQGCVVEYLYQLCQQGDEISLQDERKSQCYQATWSYIDDKRGAHRIAVEGSTPAVTLHLYAPPIESCNYFVQNGLQVTKKVHVYETV